MNRTRVIEQGQSESELETPSVSGDDYEAMYHLIGEHLHVLRTLWRDYRKETRGWKMAYAVDFQEIYAYMYPWKDDAPDSVVVDFILNNLDGPVLLPSGTIRELARHLDTIARQVPRLELLASALRRGEVDVAGLAAEHSPLLSSMRKPLRSIRRAELSQLVYSASRSLLEYEFALQRLHQFFRSNEFVTLDTLLPEAFRPPLDRELQAAFQGALDVIRPLQSNNNIADALNLAELIYYRQAIKEMVTSARISSRVTPHEVVLITHTPSLININYWVPDPTGILSRASEALRSPLELLHKLALSQQYRSRDVRINHANVAIRACETAQDRLRDLLGSDRESLGRRKRLSSYALSVSRMRSPQELVGLGDSELQAYLEDFDRYVRSPTLRSIEDVLARDEVVDVNRPRPRLPMRGPVTHLLPVLVTSARRVRELLYSLGSLALRGVEFLPREGEWESPALLALGFHSTKSTNTQLECTELRVTDSDGELVLGMDKYPDYYSVFWPTYADIQTFCRLMSEILDSRKSTVMQSDVRPEIRLFASGQMSVVPLQLPLKPLYLRRVVKSVPLTYLRIDTALGAFCYDVMPDPIQSPLMMGVISDVERADIIARLYSGSNSRWIPYPTIEAEIGIELKDYGKPGEEDVV